MTDRSSDSSTPGNPDLTRAQSSRVPGTQTIGAYRLLERVGEGGMGEVWLAEQARPVHRQVALKVIKAGMDTAQVLARFDAERQALALMDHPAIARVFDGGATPQGRPYFVMEFVRGESITAYATRHKLPLRERIELFMHVCEGVQHAHQKGIIHRDLKPSNILVTVRDDHPQPKIIDFGVAKAMTQSLTERTLHTEMGALVGTPEYMSPEQAEMGGLDIDTRTDVYSLGVMLYELLTGTLPFESKALREQSLDNLRLTIREVDPPRPSTRVTTAARSAAATSPPHADTSRLARQLRGDLDWITMKALEKDRKRRYGSVSDLAADLRRHLDDVPVLASPPSVKYRVRQFVRRHRSGVAAAGALILVLLVFAGVMAVQAGRIARERDHASQEAAAAKQLSDFLVGLFNVSDPSEARGNSITAREILDKGADHIEQTLRDQPEVQNRIRMTIGEVDTNLGVYDAAVSLLTRAVETERRSRGRDHLDTLTALNRLANAYWYQGRIAEAESLYREIVEGRRRQLGAEHRDTLRANYDLASAYSEQGRTKEAEELKLKTLSIQRRVLGDSDRDTLDSLANLSVTYFGQRRYADALPLASAAADGSLRILGPDHPETLLSQTNVASIYDRLDRNDEAEALLLRTVEKARRVLGDSHQWTGLGLKHLAHLYAKQGRYDEAERAALASYDVYRRALGPTRPRTQALAMQLAELYEAWGQPTKAADWRAKLSESTGKR